MNDVKKEFRLTPDNFEFNERGELVIKKADIVELIKQETEAKQPGAGISVEVSIAVSFP